MKYVEQNTRFDIEYYKIRRSLFIYLDASWLDYIDERINQFNLFKVIDPSEYDKSPTQLESVMNDITNCLEYGKL